MPLFVGHIKDAVLTLVLHFVWLTSCQPYEACGKYPPCTGDLEFIFCSGPILATAWQYGLENYLHWKLRAPAHAILKAFQNATIRNFDDADYVYRTLFVDQPALEQAPLSDRLIHPKNFEIIKDPDYFKFAHNLNEIWTHLARRVIDDVQIHQESYSLFYVPNVFIVPGGPTPGVFHLPGSLEINRTFPGFQEYYYWDSYWIMKGLLFCQMYDTVRGMIENFFLSIDRFGYVPNSGQIFEIRRSQPPLLTQMVSDYFNLTQDVDWLRKALPWLDQEVQFWLDNRSVEVQGHTLFQYRALLDCPRPEAFLQDQHDALVSSNDPAFEYSSIASACESGWDFSARWFSWKGMNATHKSRAKTLDIVPVDLNAIMCHNMRTLSALHRRIGNEEKVAYYDKQFANLRTAIDTVLWNETFNLWYDYDLGKGMSRINFYPSNFVPLWAECYPDESHKLELVLAYWRTLNESQNGFVDGIPASLDVTNQQWDYPNAWSPLMHFIIEGFDRTGHAAFVSEAFRLASAWLALNYRGFLHTGKMWEKYNVTSTFGVPGTGGEYPVQQGFGWTNGVALELMRKYGDRLTFTRVQNTGDPRLKSWVLAGVAVLSAVAFAIILSIVYFITNYQHRRSNPYIALQTESENARTPLFSGTR